MPAKKLETNEINDGVSAVVADTVDNGPDVPMVPVFIPVPLAAEEGSTKVDMYEHVTINGQKPTYVKRGETVEVPVPVYLQLRNRYPRL